MNRFRDSKNYFGKGIRSYQSKSRKIVHREFCATDEHTNLYTGFAGISTDFGGVFNTLSEPL